MPTAYTRPKRRPWFLNEDGEISFVNDPDATQSFVIDWSNELDSGETISSVAYTANGVTLGSTSNTTTTTTLPVTGTNGSVEVKVTTSASRVIVKDIWFYSPLGTDDDYGS